MTAWASKRHGNTPAPGRGFTLMEMLVALVVLAIAMSGAVLAFRPDHARRLGQEGERLALLLAQAEEEAQLGGTTYAWVAREEGYEFQRRELTVDGPDWRATHGDDLFRPRDLPPAARIDWVRADGRAVAYGERTVLGITGIQELAVGLVLGEARLRVERRPGGGYATMAETAG